MTYPHYPPPYPEPFVSRAVVDAAGVVITDVTCRKCGYNLRTLPASGFCPECGTPVGFSIQGDQLRYSDPAWLDRLRWGIWGIIASVGIAIVLIIARVAEAPLALTEAGGLLSSVLMLGGAWLLTAPDPSGLGEDRYGVSRKIIRGTLIAAVASQASEIFERAFPLPEAVALVFGMVQIAGGLAWLVGFFTLLHYCQKLALRIPDHFIAGRARFLKWGFAAAFAAGIVLLCAGAGLARRGAEAFVCCLILPVLLTLLVFGIMYLLMLEKLAKALKEQAAIGRQAWTGSPGKA